MPNKRYFFQVAAERVVFNDLEGMLLSDLNSARHQAARIAAELAEDESYRRFTVRVIDENGTEVCRIPIAAGIGRG